jgi:potassium-transporting ATPase KdpC subunit
MFVKQLRTGFIILVVLTVITGLFYPLAVTVIAQGLFPVQANGSILVQDGKELGTALIGQNFDDPKYFWGRLSATGPVAYTAFNADKLTGSSGSNYGPLNPALISTDPNNPGTVQTRINALKAADPDNTKPIPVDLVTASASGLDPHISPAAAEYQISRVAKARGLEVQAVQQLVRQYTEDRTLGILGEPRVNVLLLNLALDKAPGQKPPTAAQAPTPAP